MNNWQQLKLIDVADIKLSNVDKKTKPGERTIKLCNYTDVYKNSFINSDKSEDFMVASCKDTEYEKFVLRKGQVAITKDSEKPDDIGIPTYIAEDFEDVVLGYHLSLITPDENKLDGRFLNYWLNTKHAKRYFENNAGGSGQRCTLILDTIKSIPLHLPELKVQKQIAKVLSDLDAKIEVNNKINQELEALAKTIYDYWFVQFDFPDQNGKPYRSSGGKMVYNEALKREIPEGWEVEELESYADFKNGKGMKKELLSENGEYPVFGSNGTVGKTDKTLFDNPVIAIGRVGANYGEVHYSLNPCWITDNAVTSQPIKEEYLWWLLLTLKGINYSNIAGGSAQPLITQGKLKALNFAIPSCNLFDDFHHKINPIYLKINNLFKENQKLSELCDWLLPMLMNGQVTVGEVEQELGMVAEEGAKYGKG
ncbi:restriction endonuclease subunit S [Zobellia uliginosa]|uniref:restriction endonuclease subunit S n=1 Tax=Zobellia uliginosa TaxID=143224 RepID=UPI001C076EE9|nr:restriction endonuclease subunit S [Zobellia uliginosa]MBU2948052.1 restriction endonuclease subunit S [Zobellia uliginosa]